MPHEVTVRSTITVDVNGKSQLEIKSYNRMTVTYEGAHNGVWVEISDRYKPDEGPAARFRMSPEQARELVSKLRALPTE